MFKGGLCFDLDGTLIDSLGNGIERVIRIAKTRQLTINIDIEQKLKGMWGMDPLKIINTIWPDENLEGFFYEWELLDIKEPHSTFPGVKEALQKLYKHFYMSILTNRRIFNTPAQLEKNGLTKLFGIIVTPDNQGYKKPDPRIMEPIFSHYLSVGITPQDITLVGDTVEGDWKLAQATGLEFFAVLCGGMASRDKFLAAGVPADHIIDSVADLPQILLIN